MTAEELALMGYPAALQQGPIQQPSPEELAAMGAGPGVGYPMAVMQGAPAPDIQQFAPQSAAGPQMDPQTLAMMGASDPNGFTSDPMGSPVQLPGNPGEAMAAPTEATAGNMGIAGSSATNPYTPDGSANIVSQAPQADQSQYTAAAAGFPQLSEWAKASGLPREVMPDERKMIIEKYFDERNAFLARQDPEKLLNRQKLQNEIAAQGTAAANASQEQVDKALKLDESLADVQSKVDFLDKLKTHPGLSPMVGGKGISTGFMGIAVPGTDAANFNADLKRVQGQNFLTAFQQLKGAGQITEIEGAKATQAISSMSTSQSEEEFKKSLDELQGVLRTGMERTRKHYAALPSSARAAVGSLSQSQVSPSGATAPSTSPAVNRPAMLNLKGVMYQLGPDGSYHKATGAR
jgi:hypothetical protein